MDYVSTKLKNKDPSEDVDYYKDAQTTDIREYDQVFVHNDTDNFIGGVISKHTIKQVKELCQFKGSVYYLYTDPNLHLVNFARIIYDRQVRGTKTQFNTELRITENEVREFANLKWKVIWCGRDFELYRRTEYQRQKPELRCNIEATKNVEFFKYMFQNRKVELANVPMADRPFDLTYFGNWRPKRAKRIELFLGNELKKRVLGFDSEKLLLPNTEYAAYVVPEQLGVMVQQSVAAIVMGDPAHNNNIVTARFYEHILFNVCSFIDVAYDMERRLYRSKFLKEYIYVANGNELAEKIRRVRADEQLFKKIINEQNQELL